MSSSATDGGAQVAPVPILVHQLSQEPSNQDLESAALLERLHNDPGTNRRLLHSEVTSAPHTALEKRTTVVETPPTNSSITEYHALEDSLRQPPEPSSSQSALPHGLLIARQQVNNAPITGQICRYVPISSP
jgi:hypothetical protein